MIFKRRDKRPVWKIVSETVWPRRGWGRAIQYIRHRVSRLPDQPGRIARGIFAGVFVSFTPLFGLHFFLAVIISWIIRGNILASLLATFVGNPVTFVLIGAASIKVGYLVMGRPPAVTVDQSITGMFIESVSEIYHNLLAPFTGAVADWSELDVFLEAVFYPYLLGGVIVGLVFGLLAHALSLPVIRAYQKSRQKRVMKKWEKLREKTATNPADDTARND